MLKKFSKFYWCILGVFNFLNIVYELFDNPSYLCKSSLTMYNIREGYDVYFSGSKFYKISKGTGPKWLSKIK